MQRGLRLRGGRSGLKILPPECGQRPCALLHAGFSLHAATRTAGPDRRGLERLCRYVAPPALATGRLRILDADSYRMTADSYTRMTQGTAKCTCWGTEDPCEIPSLRCACTPRAT